MIVRKGEQGVDFSWTKPPAARLVELGFSFVVGYISVPPASPEKNITRAQIDGYLAAGIRVLLVWEMSANTPDQGAARGRVDGTQAKRLSEERGMPHDVPILAAVDTNSATFNIAAHEGYVRAFAEACAPYPIGVYGDTDILARVKDICRIGWVPNAWAWSSTSRAGMEAEAERVGAHVLQRRGYYIDGHWAVDPNLAIRDFPAWGTVGDAPIEIEKPTAPIAPPALTVTAAQAATGGTDMLHILGRNADQASRQRWLFNGMTKVESAEGVIKGLLWMQGEKGERIIYPGQTYESPWWWTDEDLAAVPTVKADNE